MANNPTYDDFLRAQTARRVAFEQSRKPAEQESDQGIWGDAVDMFQRGLGQTLGGDLETVGQLTDSQGVKDAGRGVSAWADGQLEQASTPMREAMGKQFFQENAETGAIEAGDAWADPRAWAGNFSTVLGQFVGLVGGTKGAGLIAKPALRGAGKLLAKDLVEGRARELVAKATVKDAIQAGALNSVRTAYLAAPGEAAKRAVLDKAIGRLTSIGYGAHAGAMASGMRAQQAEQEARGYFNGLGNDELNANPIYQQAYWDLADGEMQGADIGDIRRAAIDSVAERAATDAWSDPRALAADFASGLLTGAGGGVGGLLGKVGSTRAGAAMRGFAGEGATEAWQGGETQRAVNQAVQEWADESRDPMAGVLSTALNEGTLGSAFGGVVGAVHGPQAPDMAKPVVRIERRVVTGDQQMDDMIHGLDQRQAERGASISSEIDSMFAGASNPLGSGKFDPVRDVPAYQRQGFVRGSHDFQGKPIVPLEGELLDPATALSATPSGPLPDMGGQPSEPARDMAAIADQRISGELQDEAALPGPQANLLPGATYEGEAREVGADLPVPHGPAPALPESSNAATVPLPESVRLTRRGLPFSSEKEAALASRQDETPIPLDGGGFGIAKIAEAEQVRGEQAETVPQDINQEVRDNGWSQPLAPAVDTGYREEITATQPQVEVSNEQAPQVLAISSERQGDQPGAGQPVAESAGAATAGLSDRAGTGDRADLLASAPVPDGQQQNDQTLTAPATDAGVDVSGSADPAPLPWAESINNADGTITLKGEIPIIRQWAKDNGVKAIPGKGGVVVAKSSAAKVLDMVEPATTEPVRQIEAARAEVAPEPTEAQKEAGNYKKGHLTLQGLDIALENPKGSTRSGTDQDGKAWQSTMAHDYGYIKRTLGADGDHVDVFIGDQPDSETVFVVDQVDPKTGKFDEHKVMMGFADEQAARDGYQANYEQGWQGLGSIKAMPVEEFKRWVREGNTTKPIAAGKTEPPSKIADFGEKIGGARKDTWTAYRDTVEGETTEQIKALPLSKAWPAPAYDKLIESGMDRHAVAIARAARDAIPAKPRVSYKVGNWAQAVKSLRDLSLGLMDGTIDADTAKRMVSSASLRSAHAIHSRAELYLAVGHQRSLADLELNLGSYSLYEGVKYDPPKGIWTISRESKSGAFGGWPRIIASGSSKAEVIAEFKRRYDQLTQEGSKPKAISFAIYSRRQGQGWLVGKKVGRNHLDLTEAFESASDARKYRDEHYDELVSKLEKAKEIPHERRDINQPRVGEDMRGGADVTPELFGQAFGFRGVEFGNWVEQGRRQRDLNHAYDALMDMAAVLGISPKALSLNGELGLAFGARGSGGVNPAAAHYEHGKVVINLTKMNGAGSLGHEWWHALDGCFARTRGQPGDMMTEALDVSLAARNSGFTHRGAVRKEMIEAFGAVNRAIKQTALKERSRKLDDKRSKAYWTTARELSARAFESYLIAKLQDQNASNDYLANIVSEASWDAEAALGMQLDGSYPYPTAGEIPAIRTGFDQFFDTIEEREEGERRILFSKQAMAQGDKPAKHLTRKEAELVTNTWFKQYQGANGIDVQIHATQAELEHALGLAAKDGLIRRAAFDDDTGSLHVAADTISDPKRMREILRHEVLAHYGLANVLGDGEYTKLMSRLIQSKKDPSMKEVWDWVDTHYADEDIGTKAEEVVAHLAELEQSAWRRGWDSVAAWVTRALRAVGFVPEGITAAETRNLIEGLGKKMERGGPDDSGPDGGKKFSQEELPAKKGGIKMSQTSTAADKAMEKLNLGPKPDVIDKTKANLAKLRAVDRGVVKSWVDRFIKKTNTEVLDALAPIKYAEEAAGITDAADSGYVAARMATGAASTMQATMLYGLPEWKDGVIQRKAGTGEKDALLGIFSDLGSDLHNWLGWMAGHRAEILLAQGRENLLDTNDIAALKAQGKGKEAKFMEAKARWNRLNAATLELAQEAGLFTQEARAEFESEWYIPFFRESDDGDVIAPFKPRGVANQNAGIKKLKGGEANTNDLLENIFTSTSKLIDASMKNMAAQKTVWNLAETGIIEVVAKPNMMDWRALKNGKDLITVKMEGEDYMIRVEDPDLYRAMTFFDRKPFGAMVNVAAKGKRLLTAGVTASPEFMLRNFLRDSLSSWAISKDGFKPVIGSIRGVKKTLAMDGSTIDVMFSGASFLGGYVNGNDPGAMADTVRKSLRRKGMTPEQIARYEKSIIRNAAHAKGIVADVWEKYSRLGEAVENGNREAVYDAAIKAGKSHAQAAFESKDLMDFSMLGAARGIQGAAMVLPFFNARIQGLGKLTRELRDNPREIAKRAGMITAMSLGLLAANWDDERYEELPDWDKDANWHFFVGDQHWRIPKPFEIGVIFGTIPERMVRALGDKDTGAQFGKAVARAIGDTFALNPTPQIVKPMVEAAFNYDSFRGGPIDSPQDLAVRAEARYNEQTSLLMRELGELSGLSPKQLEHLVIGYTGTMGSYVMAAADGMIRAGAPGESASWRADEIPLVKAVYRGTGPAKSTQHMEEFYRMLNEVNQLKRTVDQYRSEGLTDKASELLEEQGGILKSRRSLSRTQQQVRVVRNKIELIQRDKTMAAEEKRRRIDELLARRNDLVYQAVNINMPNWE